MTPRRELVEPNAPLSMRWQCELLGVNRSSLYYEPVEPDGEQLALMRRMDELHLKHPFFGSRMMTQTLKAEGSAVNRKRVQRLMRLMGLESTAPKPNTSKPAPEHAVYPYLLRNLTVSRINQVWAADITYIPMARGFVYLVAVIDWYSRRAPALFSLHPWQRSICPAISNPTLSPIGIADRVPFTTEVTWFLLESLNALAGIHDLDREEVLVLLHALDRRTRPRCDGHRRETRSKIFRSATEELHQRLMRPRSADA